MTRTRLKIWTAWALISIVILGVSFLEPQFFKSLPIDFIQRFTFGVLVGLVFIFVLIAWQEIEIVDKENN
jgi:K+ transporter